MTFAARLMLILMVAASLAAQQTTTSTATNTATTTATSTATSTAEATSPAPAPLTSQEIRDQFTNLLSESPSELATILKLDPTLLSNEAYLSAYPELARFVAAHPEVRHNPRFYLSAFRVPGQGAGPLEQLSETLGIAAVFAVIAFALFWFVRTIIEQKRWSRLSQVQNEVHNKILDRFGSSAELLEYIRTPAGTKFLESAPIALHAERPAANGPATRVIWSIQIGVIIAAGALGMLLVSMRFEKETAEGLFALGAIGLSIGIGFIASALVSLFFSRRLGMSQSPDVVQ
ncbi:MAG TPA: hypothetical protein VJ276_06000 [Thermoanaerobaculia bacterium]|nr:hypothetical protein [Thermoanaerobaculia bacterium]